MISERLVVGALQVNCYVLGSEHSRQAIVIDPGDNTASILAALRRHDLTLIHILATHGHFDHVLAARSLQEATQATFYLHPADRPLLQAMQETALAWLGSDPGQPPEVSGDLEPGQTFCLDDIALEVRATPGHSPGSVSLVHTASQRVFTGDALFAGSIGRTDLPGGSVQVLLNGIRDQILSLPDSDSSRSPTRRARSEPFRLSHASYGDADSTSPSGW
jgi:glyoxylase-like metal-dependent hydrolase (beta-lactamase superfamily II)